MVAQAAVPHMSNEGMIAFLSSEAVHEFRWGMGTYAASKAALDVAITYWRNEHPDRRFSRIVIGATMPTEFGNNFTDMDVLTEALGKWAESGIPMTAMETSDVGLHLAELMGVVLAHPEIDLPDLYLDARLG
jgi:NAD(P)-dependent dehydrogenase (short-subunit alcohol dehydrogenase family)